MSKEDFSLIGDRYLVLRKVGNGKLSEVFEVMDLEKQEILAGKRYNVDTYLGLSEKFKETVLTEIHILRRIDHPHVLRCYDIVFTEKEFYLMLTFCGHGSLQSLLMESEEKTMTEGGAIDFLRQLIQGYHALFELGVVHGDIKTENIFMKSASHLLLGDLNTSKSNLRAGSVVGTELYTPPFKRIGSVQNYLHDIWAIGVVFFEMLFGVDEWYNNFVGRTFGENLVYPRSKKLSTQSKFLLQRILVSEPSRQLGARQLFGEVKFVRDPISLMFTLEFSGKLAKEFKEFQIRIGIFKFW